MTDADFSQLVTDTGRAEGCKLHAYQDPKGIWTIGFGTNLQELSIPLELAQDWLIGKLAASDREASMLFPWYAALSGARQRAIAELIYNMGLPTLRGFVKFLAAMAAGDYVTAKAELLDSKWRADVGEARANRIADLILHG